MSHSDREKKKKELKDSVCVGHHKNIRHLHQYTYELELQTETVQ